MPASKTLLTMLCDKTLNACCQRTSKTISLKYNSICFFLKTFKQNISHWFSFYIFLFQAGNLISRLKRFLAQFPIKQLFSSKTRNLILYSPPISTVYQNQNKRLVHSARPNNCMSSSSSKALLTSPYLT